jgi:phosphohistidine swiveling domain-containing protein
MTGIKNALVVPFGGWRRADAPRLGGKAIGLVMLRDSGCAVPDGFCVTTEAFRAHLGRAGVVGDDKKMLTAGEAQRAARCASIRRRIVETPLEDHLIGEIERSLAALPGGPFAARSSGTHEDLTGAAFAGLHDTELGIPDLPACLEAIRECWASFFSDRAVTYAVQRGIDPFDEAMAVIVQVLVKPRVAGVAFSVDPVSGARDRVIVESAWGLGEAVVSGRVTPDRFVVSKPDLSILQAQAGDQRVEIVAGPGGGTSERALDGRRAGRPSLDDEQVRAIARTAVEVERRAGRAMDLEWAWTDAGLVFFQGRPITALPDRDPNEDRQVWSNINTVEVLPDVVSPMTWSLIMTLVLSWRKRFGELGLDIGDAPLAGRVAGRSYFNATTMAAIGRRVPFAGAIDVGIVLGSAGEAVSDLERGLPEVRLRPLRTLRALPGLLRSVIRHHPGGVERQIAAMAERRRVAARRDLGAMSEQELLDAFDVVFDAIFEDKDLLLGPSLGMVYFLGLRAVCRRWLDDDHGATAGALLAGQGGIASAQSGHDLWKLAAWARQHPAVDGPLRSAGPFADVHAELATTPDGREFLDRWDAVLREHGHHARGEVELLNPRWSEQPDYVLTLLRGYLDSIERVDPIAQHDALGGHAAELAEACRRRLRNPLKRRIFNVLLTRARAGAGVRENLKNEAMRSIALLRSVLLALGARLQARGAVEAADDVFFIDRGELASVVKDGADLRAVVRARRVARARNEAIVPPPVVVGRFDASQVAPETPAPPDSVLRGIAASPGRATGPARVILRADDGAHVRAGEILVAPFTDPGWTPYFVPAAGIVLDRGGLLSHGSIVAREYGIPSVVNVGRATTTIRTGQMLAVDGDRGEVRLL